MMGQGVLGHWAACGWRGDDIEIAPLAWLCRAMSRLTGRGPRPAGPVNHLRPWAFRTVAGETVSGGGAALARMRGSFAWPRARSIAMSWKARASNWTAAALTTRVSDPHTIVTRCRVLIDRRQCRGDSAARENCRRHARSDSSCGEDGVVTRRRQPALTHAEREVRCYTMCAHRNHRRPRAQLRQFRR